MTQKNNKDSVIEQFLNTQRRIRKIERKALEKISSKAPSDDLCSFCGIAEEEVKFMIHGDGEARICSNCIMQIPGLLNDSSNE